MLTIVLQRPGTASVIVFDGSESDLDDRAQTYLKQQGLEHDDSLAAAFAAYTEEHDEYFDTEFSGDEPTFLDVLEEQGRLRSEFSNALTIEVGL